MAFEPQTTCSYSIYQRLIIWVGGNIECYIYMHHTKIAQYISKQLFLALPIDYQWWA